jgi:acetamidase/formamidase
MINTIKYAKILEGVGFSRDQAESSLNILVEVMNEQLATKSDFEKLEIQIAALLNTMGTAMATKTDLAQLKSDLTLKMGTMLSATVALVTALVTIVHKFA